ncbi:hypothetical protein F4678DRAFT_482490 [Xylaria arbuscula]|nr:hypothetical protein F4678DRAFT_482490 [Xylaria arbuscula]
MATTPSSAVAQPAVGQTLQDAVNEFRSVLDEEQRRELDKLKPVPDTDAILVFTAKLDATDRNRRGRSFASRLHTILLAVRNFCSIVDTFVSSHPEIAALIWGSVRLTMLVISKYTSYYEATSGLFMRVGRLCPLFNEYVILYRSSTRLRQSLLDFHKSTIHCCKHVIDVIKRPWSKQLLQAFWNSFEQEFKPDIDSIQKCSKNVKDEIGLAQAQAYSQEQHLQALERENASLNRSTAQKFFSRTDKRLHQIREWEIQRNARKEHQILDELSTYDHLRSLKQSRLKRHKNTSNWIFQMSEFRRWVDGVVPLLCCFGKSKSTAVIASLIDHILSERGSDCVVSFFFVESGNLRSLGADTIIRSILRQRLDPTQVPQEVYDGLEGLDSFSELEEFVKLLRIMMPPPRVSYIIIDGLDECEKPDRDRLLTVLSSLAAPGQNIRLFLSSRDSLRGEIQSRFTDFDSLSMDCPLAHDSISMFIEDIVKEKIQSNDISIGDPSLGEEIKLALSHGAQGMFLWVTFQIYELCAQHCDEDIRNILQNLPKGLTEVYCRALQRIRSRGHQKQAQKIFPWIAASKQLLSLGQLREAIAIEIGQQYSIPERLYNDMPKIALWCENLVQVDEEYQLVQFSHSTIRKFLIEEPLDSTLAEFHVNLEEADHDIGEKCITYLHFNDFKTTVARRPKPMLLHDTTQIAQSALGYKSKPALILAKLRPKVTSRPDPSGAQVQLVLGHPFLDYASSNWILHTTEFRQESSKTWQLWENMVIYGHDLVESPWGENTSNVNNPILRWACDAHHSALIRLIASSDILLKGNRLDAMFYLVEINNTAALKIFLRGQDLGATIDRMLPEAAESGHLRIVERLLAANADVNAADRHGRTALQTAAKNGHVKVVEKLLTAGANVNAVPVGWNSQTALQAAAGSGHFEIVERLIAENADVNIKNHVDGNAGDHYDGLMVLQEAKHESYLKIASLLRQAGARE